MPPTQMKGGLCLALAVNRRVSNGASWAVLAQEMSGRCQIGQGTSAVAYSGDGLAPIPDLPVLAPGTGRFDPNQSFRLAVVSRPRAGPRRRGHRMSRTLRPVFCRRLCAHLLVFSPQKRACRSRSGAWMTNPRRASPKVREREAHHADHAIAA
jgi:hypothetical protein